jgi:hypothetical protein
LRDSRRRDDHDFGQAIAGCTRASSFVVVSIFGAAHRLPVTGRRVGVIWHEPAAQPRDELPPIIAFARG